MSDVVCLTNENLEFQYNVLESVINKPELLDVPIVIYSLAGPERTGKSYLLNLLWYLLKTKDTDVLEEEKNEQTVLPQIFQHRFCTKAVTKGVYMTTQPVFKSAENKSKVAVFLMETQGINSGDQIEFKEGDIFTISLQLSFMQIINLKERLQFLDIDTYAALTLFANHVNGVTEKKKKLMFLLRDWKHTDLHDHGYDDGNKCYKKMSENLNIPLQFECLQRFYEKEECFLMPPPGRRVEKPNSKHIRDIKKKTCSQFKNLFEILFSSSNIQQASLVAPKGKDFLQHAKTLGENLSKSNRDSAPKYSFKDYLVLVMQFKVTDSCEIYKKFMEGGMNLKASMEALTEAVPVKDPEPYVKDLEEKLSIEKKRLFEVVMKTQIHECLDHYKKLMRGCTYSNGNDLQKCHDEKGDVAISKLLEQNPIEKNSPHVESLQNDLSAQYEDLFKVIMKNQLKECLDYYKELMCGTRALNGNKLWEKNNEFRKEAIAKLLRQNPIQNNSCYIESLQIDTYSAYQGFFTEVMKIQMNECLKYYREVMSDCTHLNEKELAEKHEKTSKETAEKLLRQNPIQKDSPYVQQLQADIHAEYEIYIGRHLCVEYATEWATKVVQEGNFKESVVSEFFLEEGKKYVQKISAKVTNKSSQKVVFNEFVKTMSEKFNAEIERRKSNRRRAKTAGVATGGMVAGALSILIPPLGAIAVASTLATELAGVLIAGGIGAAGAAATGGSTYIIDRLVQNKVDVPDLRVFIDPILGDEQTKSKNISVRENDCETQPLLP